MTGRFSFTQTPLKGVWIAERLVNLDKRGSFSKLFCEEEFSEIIGSRQILQINHSVNRERGTTRGLHYQIPPFSETKIITCLKGEIFDVAVDIRTESDTFLNWHGEILSAENSRTIVIPEGFAHGFQTLVPDCEVMYLHTGRYMPEHEGNLHVRDPAVGIRWPLEITCISERDSHHPRVDGHFQGVCL